MKFVIEFDGALADVAPAWYAAHEEAAAKVGWSRLDQPTFWRLTRTKGREAPILPGAKPIKAKEYYTCFDRLAESDDTLARVAVAPETDETLRKLTRHGELVAVTLGSNLAARRAALGRDAAARFVSELHTLSGDPRRRPGELAALAGGAGSAGRVLVVASSDALIRAAGQAELVTAGVASGPCSIPRLKQAGADVVYRELAELADSFACGAQDLQRAGLLPSPPGG